MGVELLLGAMLGFVILGPKRMHELVGQVGRAKAQFDKSRREITSQLEAELAKKPDDHTPAAAEQ